jgi:hypothetical protein
MIEASRTTLGQESKRVIDMLKAHVNAIILLHILMLRSAHNKMQRT